MLHNSFQSNHKPGTGEKSSPYCDTIDDDGLRYSTVWPIYARKAKKPTENCDTLWDIITFICINLLNVELKDEILSNIWNIHFIDFGMIFFYFSSFWQQFISISILFFLLFDSIFFFTFLQTFLDYYNLYTQPNIY